MKKHLLLALRIVFAIAGIAYIVYAIQWTDQGDREGVMTMLRKAQWSHLIGALLLIAPVYPIQTLRWWLLMRCRGMQVPLSRAFRLVMVGSFFNYCMPGTTGGDVIKAWYAARRSDRRTDAVMSVIFDRITGLLGLILLAGIAGLTMLDDPVARRVTQYIWLGAAAIILISAAYFSRHLRQWLGVQRLLGKLDENALPGKIDQAAVAYGSHKAMVTAAILISVPVHLLIAAAAAVAGYALGIDPQQSPPALMLTVIPVLNLAGSVPLTYQGLGVMEFLGEKMLTHADFNQIAGMLMLMRLAQVVYSLMGSAFLLRGDIHLHPEQHGDGESSTGTPTDERSGSVG